MMVSAAGLKSSVFFCLLGLGLVLAGCSGGSSSSSEEGDQPSPPPGPSFSLRGSVGIEASTRVDGDTTDLLSFGTPRLSEPQRLPSTFILGGYLSYDSGVRDPNNAFDDFEADPVDRFQVPMVPGERITLDIFSEYAAAGEVALRLLDQNEVLVVPQVTTVADGDRASLILPEQSPADSYIVELEAGRTDFPAPVRYVMTKLPPAVTAAFHPDWPGYEFLPGRALINLAENASGQAAALSQSLGHLERRLVGNHWLAVMPGSRMASSSNPAGDTLRWIEALRRQPGVNSAVPDYIMSAQSPLDEPLFPFQWHYGLIDAPAAWQLAPNGGDGTVVAVLDTGLFRDDDGWHPDLVDNLVSELSGSDFVDGDDLPADVANEVASSVFHGTHVAGTVAASAGNNLGGTGVAFNSGLLPVRVLGEGGTGSPSDLIAALEWIGETDPPRAGIVNLSLGGLPFISGLQEAIDGLSEKGIIIVAASGNQSSSVPTFPAAADNVFAVTAVDGAGNLASYSNFGPWVDLAAPGGDGQRDANLDGRPDLVVSASASFTDGAFRPGYTGLQGTSMASPHVAGVFALMKGINPELDYEQLKAFLLAGELTNPVAGGRSDSLGYGLINASRAVLTAIDNPSITVLSTSPSFVNLSSETNPAQEVLLERTGSADNAVLVDESIVAPPWLDVSVLHSPLRLNLSLVPDVLEPGESARFTLEVNYTSDSQRSLQLPVVAELVTDEQARNAGPHFVLLVNTVPVDGRFEAAAQIRIPEPNENGAYDFAFRFDDGVAPKEQNEIAQGEYFLVAGTDLDNDGIICQPGEACAEYPVTGLREVVIVNENTNLSRIQMTTGFSRPGISASTPDILPRPDFQGYRLLGENAVSENNLKTIGVDK